jgi:HSP20 family protein
VGQARTAGAAKPPAQERQEEMMAVFSDPFDALTSFQQALDAFRESDWLDAGPSGGGAYPPMNVFRKGDDFIIITEIPGVKKSELEVQVKGRTLRLTGAKSVAFPEKAAVHRRERIAGRFDRAITLPVEINPDGVKAEYQNGILALFLPRAESEKAKTIKIG